MRFDDHFTFEINVQDDISISELNIPPLIIQPYAENAVWHGLMIKREKGHLIIEVLLEKENLYLKIRDDGIGRANAARLAGKVNANHKSMGLSITSQRISMVQKAGEKDRAVVINDLVDAEGNSCGTEVVIKLPVIYD